MQLSVGYKVSCFVFFLLRYCTQNHKCRPHGGAKGKLSGSALLGFVSSGNHEHLYSIKLMAIHPVVVEMSVSGPKADHCQSIKAKSSFNHSYLSGASIPHHCGHHSYVTVMWFKTSRGQVENFLPLASTLVSQFDKLSARLKKCRQYATRMF